MPADLIPLENLRGIGASPTLAAAAHARAWRAAGNEVVDLTVGEPIVPVPDEIRDAAMRCIRDGDTRYGAPEGLPALRSSVAALVAAEASGLGATARNVAIAAGSKQAIFNAAFCVLGPGDDALIPTPAWPSYADIVRLARANPIAVMGDPDACWKVDPDRLDAAATERTRAVILNSPCNPTGALYDTAELRAIVRLAEARGWWVISDEIYRGLSYGADAPGIASAVESLHRAVIVDGLAKRVAMTGWRLGWTVASPELTTAIATLQSQTSTHANMIAQHAALAAVASPDVLAALTARTRDAMAARRTIAIAALDEYGIRYSRPDAAFYTFIEVGGDDVAFTRSCLESCGVAVVPGSAFGVSGWIRASFSGAIEDVRSGYAKLAEYVSQRR